MKISYNWLKDFVSLEMKPEELADRLTMAGLEVVSTQRFDNDYIMDIEVTPNRPDLLAVIGVAREVSALTGKKLKLPKVVTRYKLHFRRRDQKNVKRQTWDVEPISIEIKDEQACPRYVGRLISNLKVRPSPDWLQRRLRAVGIKPINNVVDITNYCLMELGQPLHAFDYEKLCPDKRILIRWAKEAEEILTLDGVKRPLSTETLVIADRDRPVAIAGIMGGKDTEVGPYTKTVLLESAYFDPVTIRRASRRLGLITESSYRFERGVTREVVLTASDRAAGLIYALAQGEPASPIIDTPKRRPKTRVTSLRPSRVNLILGIDVPVPTIKKILKALGFKVVHQGRDRLRVSIPSFRQDIAREIDLIEEVARFWGYHNIPVTMPQAMPEFQPPRPKPQVVEDIVRNILISLGLNEVITYGLISPESLKKADMDGARVVKVKNPLSRQQEIMRPSHIPGLLESLCRNLSRQVKDIKIFELGHVYLEAHGRYPHEKPNLSILLCGSRLDNWQMKTRPVDFFDLKGIVEVLLARLGISNYQILLEPNPLFVPGSSATLEIRGRKIGFMGKVCEEVLDRFDIGEETYVCELGFGDLLDYVSLDRKFVPVPRYPPVSRDVAIVVNEHIPSSQIVSCITRVGGKLLRDVKLFDQYFGEQIPAGRKGLAYSIEYQAKDRTLTDQEVNVLHSKICEALARELGAGFR